MVSCWLHYGQAVSNQEGEEAKLHEYIMGKQTQSVAAPIMMLARQARMASMARTPGAYTRPLFGST
jgi:hypothetical protein